MPARLDYQQKALECLKAAEGLHDPGERLDGYPVRLMGIPEIFGISPA